jgi:hypothetical protein
MEREMENRLKELELENEFLKLQSKAAIDMCYRLMDEDEKLRASGNTPKKEDEGREERRFQAAVKIFCAYLKYERAFTAKEIIKRAILDADALLGELGKPPIAPIEEAPVKVVPEAVSRETLKERERCLAAVDVEDELPGDMPDNIWAIVRDDRDAASEILRLAVRATKQGIRDRIEVPSL